jgi:hypothetical protein
MDRVTIESVRSSVETSGRPSLEGVKFVVNMGDNAMISKSMRPFKRMIDGKVLDLNIQSCVTGVTGGSGENGQKFRGVVLAARMERNG